MADIKKVLARLAEELDKEEREELLAEMKGRKLTGAELLAAIKELDPATRKEVREALADVQEDLENEDDEDDDDKTKPKKKAKLKAVDNDDDDDEDDDDKRKTRPGRKSGRAYDWTVEDGKVIRLDYAKVYSGDDEPDRVEITDEDEDEDDDDGKEDVA